MDAARDERVEAVKALAEAVVDEAYAAEAPTDRREQVTAGIHGAEGNIEEANGDIAALQAQAAALQQELDLADGDAARQAKLLELTMVEADLAQARAAKAQGGADKANGRVTGLVIDTRSRDQQLVEQVLASTPELDEAEALVERAEHKYEQAQLDARWYDDTRALFGTVVDDATAAWALDATWPQVRTIGRALVEVQELYDELTALE